MRNVMKDVNDAINPQTLKATRKRHRMTQQQLADAIRCTKDTISRWERGKSKRIRSHLREPLCKVLRIKWEELIEPTKPKKVLRRNYTTNVSISRKKRTSLQLVAERYNVRPRVVLESAPLLFLIVAELSLLERKRRLENIKKVLEQTRENLRENFRQNYASYNPAIIDVSEADNRLEEEEKWLNRRELNATDMHYYPKGPFFQFIQELIDKLPKDAVTHIAPEDDYDFGFIDDYSIAGDTLRECTGISEDDEKGEILLKYIRESWIDFAECLRVKRKETDENYRKWLITQLTQIQDTATEIKGFPEGERLIKYIRWDDLDFAECLRVKRRETDENYRKWLITEIEKIEEAKAKEPSFEELINAVVNTTTNESDITEKESEK